MNGCTNAAPLFADTVFYHLQSEMGNYAGGYFAGGAWSSSAASSPLIDQGDPLSPYSEEPQPNGRRINMGAYGNTPVASKTRIAAGAVFTIR